jgi:hypothetical protein
MSGKTLLARLAHNAGHGFRWLEFSQLALRVHVDADES